MSQVVGNFVGSSTWLPDLPQSDQFYSMGLSLYDQRNGEQGIGIAVIDLADPVILGADFFDIPPGLGIWFSRHTENDELLASQFVPIDESLITGDILLYLGFDAITQSFNAAFSLDGGASILDPFLPDMTGPVTLGNWSFGAESVIAIAEPSSLGCFGLALAGLFWRQRRVYTN